MQQPFELLAQIETIEMNFHIDDPVEAALQNIIAARVLVNFAMDALNSTDNKLKVVSEMTSDADDLLLSITHAIGKLTGRETPNRFAVRKHDDRPIPEKNKAPKTVVPAQVVEAQKPGKGGNKKK